MKEGVFTAIDALRRKTLTRSQPTELCYGTEVVIPVDIGVPSIRVLTFDPSKNDGLLQENLDSISEIRDNAAQRTATYQRHVTRLYDRRVKPRPINVGDLVLRNIEAAEKGPQKDKLSPAWEGPYVVTATVKPGTLKLRTAEEKTLPRTWNVQNLRRFYQ